MNQPGLVKGGIYLLSGAPAAGKTTLALQIAADIAEQGHQVVYITFEQSIDDIKAIIDDRIYANLPSTRAIEENLYLEESVAGVADLPDFLTRRVGFGDLQGTELIIVDSLQGHGLSGAATRLYQKVYEFTHKTKEARIPVILTSHVTKAGSIAGPRSLEHNVDCVLYMRKAMRLRPLFVPKNRFGPERHEPHILTMNSNGVLEPSKHMNSTARVAYGFIPSAERPVEVQATVKLPRFGETAKIKAPYLPREVIRQIVEIVGGLNDIDISEMTFDINCAIPGSRPFSRLLDLPLAVSMLSSYLQREIPGRSLFIGELDLFRNIRPVEPADRVQALSNLIADSPSDGFYQIYANTETALQLKAVSTDLRGADLIEVDSLDRAIDLLWPDIAES